MHIITQMYIYMHTCTYIKTQVEIKCGSGPHLMRARPTFNVYLCVYVYTCMRLYVHVWYYMYVYLLCTCICACICSYVYLYVHICVNMCMYILLHFTIHYYITHIDTSYDLCTYCTFSNFCVLYGCRLKIDALI